MTAPRSPDRRRRGRPRKTDSGRSGMGSLTSGTRTRRAYQIGLCDFMTFVGIVAPTEFRTVTRAHVIAWRKVVETRGAAPATIRRKRSALSSLFEHLYKVLTVPDAIGIALHEWYQDKQGVQQELMRQTPVSGVPTVEELPAVSQVVTGEQLAFVSLNDQQAQSFIGTCRGLRVAARVRGGVVKCHVCGSASAGRGLLVRRVDFPARKGQTP